MDIPWRQALFRTLVEDESGYGGRDLEFKSIEEEKKFFDLAIGFIRAVISPANADSTSPTIVNRDYNLHLESFYIWVKGAEALRGASALQIRNTFQEEFYGASDSKQGLRCPQYQSSEMSGLLLAFLDWFH
jgi:hypothetical protein